MIPKINLILNEDTPADCFGNIIPFSLSVDGMILGNSILSFAKDVAIPDVISIFSIVKAAPAVT